MTVTGLFQAASVMLVVTGLCLFGLTALVVRRGDALGTSWIGVTALVLALASTGSGLLLLAGGVRDQAHITRDATIWLTQCVEVMALGWFVFALQYTGRGEFLTHRRLAAGSGLYAVPAAVLITGGFSGWLPPGLEGTLSIWTSLYGIGLTLVGATVVVQTVNRHGYLNDGIGWSLGVMAFIPWFLSTAGLFAGLQSPRWVLPTGYATGFLACSILLWVATVHLDGLTRTVATYTVGRQAALSKTAELVLVVDSDERIVDLNETARRQLAEPDAIAGQPFSSVVATPVEELSETTTLELRTNAGVRQFDVEVVPLASSGDTDLGILVSLRDVTDRQQREQGLNVLNRILRHNIRNQLSVIAGHHDAVGDAIEGDDGRNHLDRSRESIDALVELSDRAREAIVALERDPADVRPVAVTDTAERIVASLRERFPDSDVVVDGADVTIQTHERLFAVALENTIENALEHSDAENPAATVHIAERDDGVRVRVTDNGPGIPSSEVEAIQRGSETALTHASSIGLWLIKWAITSCGGTVEFRTGADGGRVDLWIPTRDGDGDRNRRPRGE